MPVPSSREIHDFLHKQTEIFNNKSRKQEFMDLYKSMAPGGYTLEWPANGEVFEGWDHLDRMWEDGAEIQSTLVTVLVSNGEAAGYFTHKGRHNGQPFTAESIETYLFREDGTLHSRFWPPTPDL